MAGLLEFTVYTQCDGRMKADQDNRKTTSVSIGPPYLGFLVKAITHGGACRLLLCYLWVMEESGGFNRFILFLVVFFGGKVKCLN